MPRCCAFATCSQRRRRSCATRRSRGDEREGPVTGGSGGIGAATARLAGARGYAVCVNYRRDRAAAEHVVRDVEAAGSTAIAVRADVAIEAEVVRLFEESHTQLGALSALVNNTEILETQARLDAMTVDRLQRIFTTNVIGAVHRRDRRPIGVDSCDLSFQFAVISARIDGRFTRMRPKETPC